MGRSFRIENIPIVMTVVLGVCLVSSLGCGSLVVDGILGLETCDVLNCDGLFFSNLAEDHDEDDDETAHDAEDEDGPEDDADGDDDGGAADDGSGVVDPIENRATLR